MKKFEGVEIKQNIFSKKVIAGVLVVVLIGGGVFAYTKVNAKPKPTFMEITSNMQRQNPFSEVEFGNISESLSASGDITLSSIDSVYPSKSNLTVKKINFKENDPIKKGDVILTYDVQDTIDTLTQNLEKAKINLANAQLDLQSANAPLAQAKTMQYQQAIDSAQKTIDSSTNKLSQAQKDLEEAQNNYDNQLQKLQDTKEQADKDKQLFDAGAISASDYNLSLNAADSASSQLNSLERTLSSKQDALQQATSEIGYAQKDLIDAQKTYDLAKNPLSDPSAKISYEKMQNNIKSYQLEVETTKKALNEVVSEEISPSVGTVVTVNVTEGLAAASGTPVVTITDYNNLIVVANISEYDIGSIYVGQKVSMYSDGNPDKIYTGEVTEIANQAKSVSVTNGTENVVPIKVSIDNQDNEIKAGFGLNLDIETVNLENVLTIPTSAVLTDEKTKEKYVFLMNSQTKSVEKKVVEVGQVGTTLEEVKSGVAEKDKVITAPTDKIKDNMTMQEVITAIYGETETSSSSDKKSSGFSLFGGGGASNNRQQGNFQGSKANTGFSRSGQNAVGGNSSGANTVKIATPEN